MTSRGKKLLELSLKSVENTKQSSSQEPKMTETFSCSAEIWVKVHYQGLILYQALHQAAAPPYPCQFAVHHYHQFIQQH